MYKILSSIIVAFIVGVLGGYVLANKHPKQTDLEIRSFAASYGALRNIKEKSDDDAINLLYTIMNNSIKEMYALYPEASDHHKQMIYKSFKGYSNHIKANNIYTINNSVIDALVDDLIQKHNKSFNLDGEKNAPPS